MKQRVDYIDAFKGIGIVLMIMGHIGFGKDFHMFIHLFHMPMFFFVSGYLFSAKKQKYKEFIIKKIKSLLVPYYFFGTVYLFFLYLNGNANYNHVESLLFFCTNELPVSGGLWFLMSLFIADNVFFFINYIKKQKYKYIVTFIISIIGQLFKKVTGFVLPFGIGPACVGVGLMLAGVIFREHEKFLYVITRNIGKYPVLIACGLFTWVVLKSDYRVNMRTECYSGIISFWIISCFYIIVVFVFSKWICNKNMKKIKTTYLEIIKEHLSNFFIIVGSLSVVYVIINQPVIDLLFILLDKYTIPIVLSHLICLFFALFLMVIAAEIIKRTKFKIFFGIYK